ncbi:WD40-repeat-containing domain protein [Ganoderma leucocontextum]|nr:WD40-repeat-containing domain protein [Ganoderma leucocontextum]
MSNTLDEKPFRSASDCRRETSVSTVVSCPNLTSLRSISVRLAPPSPSLLGLLYPSLPRPLWLAPQPYPRSSYYICFMFTRFFHDFVDGYRGYNPSSYRRTGRVTNVGQPIYAIALSPDGRMFAYGGRRGPEVRMLATTALLHIPDFYPEVYGSVTTLHWLDESELLIGTAMGFLVLWSKREEKFEVMTRIRLRGGGEVISVASAVQGDGFRMVLGTLDCGVACIDWCERRGTVEIWNTWGQRSHEFIPRALSIREDGSVRVISLHNGVMFILDGNNGDFIGAPQSFVDPIGSAAIDERKELIAIAHSGGFTLHDPKSREGTVAVYKAGKSRTDLPKPIIFGEARRVVIIGSDHGKVYVFNKKKGGLPVDTLVHSDDGTELVQSVTTYYDGGRSIILCATSSSTEHPSISIWERIIPERQAKRSQYPAENPMQVPANAGPTALTFRNMFQIVCLLCILNFIVSPTRTTHDEDIRS